MTVVNFEFGARQCLSAMWAWSWDSAHRAVVTFMLRRCEKMIVTIDMMDVYNREVSKFSQ